MGLFNAIGENITQNNVKEDLENAYITLKKSGDFETVRVYGMNVVEYDSHSFFAKKLYTTPCISKINNGFCPYCTAVAKDKEYNKNFYKKPRLLFAFGVLGEDVVKVIDLSKTQGMKLISQIKEYADDLNDFAFKLKREGADTTTSYTLNLIPKMTKEQRSQFDALEGLGKGIDEDFYTKRLRPKSPVYMVKNLHDAGFDVNAHFEQSVLNELNALLAKSENNTADTSIEDVI